MKRESSVITADEIRSRLAANLRRLRAEHDISQERLALEAGIDRTMLSKIERQISNPSIETLLKLANRLTVDIVALIEPVEQESTPATRSAYPDHTPKRRVRAPLAVHEVRARVRK